MDILLAVFFKMIDQALQMEYEVNHFPMTRGCHLGGQSTSHTGSVPRQIVNSVVFKVCLANEHQLYTANPGSMGGT